MASVLRKMRVVAIPLTRPNPNIFVPTAGKSTRLTYYRFQTPKTEPKSTSALSTEKGSKENDSPQSKKTSFLPEEGVINWATRKATETWVGWGKEKGGWKLKVYQAGERLADRIEFEELALKSIDPSFGPSITHLKQSAVLDQKHVPEAIPLIYPPGVLSPTTALEDLKLYTSHRIPRHRRGFYFWMFIAPLTAPFMIIPFRSSQYLQSLLQHDLIVPEADPRLDTVYGEHKSTDSSSTASEGPHQILLSKDAVSHIANLYDLDSAASADVTRAIDQSHIRVSEGRLDV